MRIVFTGLDFRLTLTIVQAYDGAITIASEVGKGRMITVRLPAGVQRAGSMMQSRCPG